MKNLALVVASLMYIGIAFGEDCRIKTPIKSSLLRCRDKVYSMDANYIAVVNACFEGRNGLPVTLSEMGCAFQKVGWAIGGVPQKKAMREAASKYFGEHGDKMVEGILKCYEAGFSTTISCFLDVYFDVCGYRTCDYVNSLDESSNKEEL